MQHPGPRVLARVGAVTALALLATLVVFLALRSVSGVPYDWVNLAECVAIPLLVAPPILFCLFSQSERLQQQHERSAALSATIETAHRDLQEACERLRHAASHDKMTGLLNREAFLAELEAATEERSGVLLMADADHFKQINDQLGHLRGDQALVLIAAAIREAVRPGDVIGRIGGEEFGILLRRLDLQDAGALAEKIRRQVELIPWPPTGERGKALSVSIGLAEIGANSTQATDILGNADRRLYEAKAMGRNRIVTGPELSEVA